MGAQSFGCESDRAGSIPFRTHCPHPRGVGSTGVPHLIVTMNKTTATVDTNIAPLGDLVERAAEMNVEVAVATTTERELASHSYGESLAGVKRIMETAVWDESLFDNCVLAGEPEVDSFEDVLRIISNGSFPRPGDRGNLRPRQRNQLRDAMIFSAHVRERRDIFVTLDGKGFIRQGRKQKLEAAYKTQIMTLDEFMRYLTSRAAI